MSNLSQLELKEKLAYLWKKVAQRFESGLDDSHLSLGNRDVLEANYQASRSYIPQVYPGQITLFQAKLRSPRVFYDSQGGWGELALGGVEVHNVPGDHTSIIEQPHVRVLAEKLKACLDKAQAETSLSDSSKPNNLQPNHSTTEVKSVASRPSPSQESALWSSLVPIQPNGSKPPLFCIHAIGGNVLGFANLVRCLGQDQPVYGLQASGGDKRPIILAV